ncbi:MAG TPA: 30S ribosomal protein S16 [Thermoguttaceae bacterium]|nr:30S ribosomal protein S16 [Thermoguttaceae bacterium]
MAVRIRMKKLGRKHRPFFRICAIDQRASRDARVIEELGTYDPMVPETDARAILNRERVQYWLGVGAQPSDRVGVLIKKYGLEGTHVAQQEEALKRLAQQRSRPEAPTVMPQPKREKQAETEEATADAE